MRAPNWSQAKWAVLLVGLSGAAACGTTEPGSENPVPSHLVIPPIQNYTFSAVVNPGCQDTGYGINDAGMIIGHACNAAFRKLSNGTMQVLAPLSNQGANGMAIPLDINQGGRVVGYSYQVGGNSMRPVQWIFIEGGMGVFDLGVLPGGSRGQAWGVNVNSDVVGWSEIAMAGGVIRKHGFLRRSSGLMIDLVPANCYANAEAYDLNDQSFVVGVSYTLLSGSGCSGLPTRLATHWKPTGSGSNTLLPVPLPTLYSSEARAINNAGDMAGYHRSTSTGGSYNLAKWKVNTSDFTVIGPSDSYTVPEDINEAGLIVGEREVNGVRVAFAYGTKFATMPVPVTTARSFAMGVNSCGNLVGEGHQVQSNGDHQVAAKWTRTGC
jgi:uncharacterized membrane protein